MRLLGLTMGGGNKAVYINRDAIESVEEREKGCYIVAASRGYMVKENIKEILESLKLLRVSVETRSASEQSQPQQPELSQQLDRS